MLSMKSFRDISFQQSDIFKSGIPGLSIYFVCCFYDTCRSVVFATSLNKRWLVLYYW